MVVVMQVFEGRMGVVRLAAELKAHMLLSGLVLRRYLFNHSRRIFDSYAEQLGRSLRVRGFQV